MRRRSLRPKLGVCGDGPRGSREAFANSVFLKYSLQMMRFFWDVEEAMCLIRYTCLEGFWFGVCIYYTEREI